MSSSVHILGGGLEGKTAELLSSSSMQFLSALHRRFNARRKSLLHERELIQERLDCGVIPEIPAEFRGVRSDSSWRVASIPKDLERRWVEITGPVERRQVINALNSGADCYMADFEDATAPTWSAMVRGQLNIRDAIKGTISVTLPNNKERRLKEKTATMLVRPRGWHLEEAGVYVDGERMSASLFDAGLYLFTNGAELERKGECAKLYLPKLESCREAQLWADVLEFSEEQLRLKKGSIRVTVLVETILGAIQMEEIMFALRRYLCGLNAGRWDYIFSIIKRFRSFRNALLPDRLSVSMGVPFMRAYCLRLVSVCHSRGAHAIGGMAANVPSRTDKEANEKALRLVNEDKERELKTGFDGTWVAHPDLVAPVRKLFSDFLKNKDHQKEKMVPSPPDSDLLAFETALPNGIPPVSSLISSKSQTGVTVKGVEVNISAALQYIAYWISGRGAVAIDNKMEDAATAEISRAQLWQWIKWRVPIGDTNMSIEFYNTKKQHEVQRLKSDPTFQAKEYLPFATALLDKLVMNDYFVEFLTSEAYEFLLRAANAPSSKL